MQTGTKLIKENAEKYDSLYRENGFVVIVFALSADLIARVNTKFDEVMAENYDHVSFLDDENVCPVLYRA